MADAKDQASSDLALGKFIWWLINTDPREERDVKEYLNRVLRDKDIKNRAGEEGLAAYRGQVTISAVMGGGIHDRFYTTHGKFIREMVVASDPAKWEEVSQEAFRNFNKGEDKSDPKSRVSRPGP